MSDQPIQSQPVVLVTGSTGLIGSQVCRALAGRYEVVGLDREPPDEPGPEFWIECDLTDDGSVREALGAVQRRAGEELASVLHLAAYYDFSGEPSPLYEQLTVEGTRRLLRALSSFRVGQLVFSSSLLVMRAVEPGERVDEESPVEAEWDYPASKLAAEAVIREERGRTPAVVLRIAGVYDEACRSIPIAQQMRRIYERQFESYFFPGHQDRGQPYVHREDVVECFRAVVERRGELGEHELFLIAEPDLVSYGELQDTLGELLHGHEWPTIRIPTVIAKVGAWLKDKVPGQEPFIKPWMIDLADAHMPVSIERARRRLGWEPRHRLRSELPAMARWMTADPARWYRENGLEAPDDLAEIERRRRERTAQGSRHGR